MLDLNLLGFKRHVKMKQLIDKMTPETKHNWHENQLAWTCIKGIIQMKMSDEEADIYEKTYRRMRVNTMSILTK